MQGTREECLEFIADMDWSELEQMIWHGGGDSAGGHWQSADGINKSGDLPSARR